MSRLFNQVTGTYLQVDSSPVTTTPLTMHCWFNITGAVTFNTVFSIQQSNADNWWRLRARSYESYPQRLRQRFILGRVILCLG